jgi:alcohol dehydrogenase class IV
MTSFEFVTVPRIRFGAGAVGDAGDIVRGFGTRALVVTGGSMERAAPVTDQLTAGGTEWHPFQITFEPDVASAERGASFARDVRAEVVVAVGGGSVIDAAKAIAALATNDGDPFDYLEVVGRGLPLTAAPLPVIAIPTTAGTGSEVTKNAVLTVPVQQVKVSLRSTLMIPRVAIIDPMLTLDLPPALTAATGLDALTQLIEPYLSSKANPMTDALCLDGLPRVARSLRRAVEDGRDLDARTDMAMASLLGGMALANAGLGAVHGFAGPLGGVFGAPHGALCATLLPHVMRANLRALDERASTHPARRRFDDLGPLLTGSQSAAAADAIAWVRDLVAACEIPRLGRYGVTMADVPRITMQAAKSSSMNGNAIPLTDDELGGVLESAI